MSLVITGVGFSAPNTIISNQVLSQISSDSTDTGVRIRHSLLDKVYLEKTGNVDVSQALKNLEQDPLVVAKLAALDALKAAGIDISEVALLIGSATTQFQTIPSEGQRIAGALGLKIPAYDILASTCSFLMQLDVLSAWKIERVPSVVMLAFTDFPTTTINYKSASSDTLALGDATSAAVIQKNAPKGLKVGKVSISNDPSKTNSMNFSMTDQLEISTEAFDLIEEQTCKAIGKAIFENGYTPNSLMIVPSCLSPRRISQVAKTLSISEQHFLSFAADYGNCLCSGHVGALAHYWKSFQSGDHILVVAAGPGLLSGYALLEVL